MAILNQAEAREVLFQDAEKIKQIIENKNNVNCIAQCKAFEEVLDTHMYGFSKEVDFAVRLNLLSRAEGQQLMAELERQLNQMYNDIYEEYED
ncbi:MAG: YlaN family protein [Streptococcaceae bacterium]|jgi:uncharacterized protein YlaN (UPF0358 family)|nr:YlaN family protein [Streptococcaceae bacterium]MCH4176450.1 YlaN family protein [Streptococcaceae bacterium]